jgi:hypothetical protein
MVSPVPQDRLLFSAKLRDVFTDSSHAPLINRLLSVITFTCYFFPSKPI